MKREQTGFDSDSWERFERAVDAAVKSGPKHRVTPKPKSRRKKPTR